MFTGGSDDEAVCIRVVSAFATNAGWYRQEHFERNARRRSVAMTTTARPHETIQKNLSTVAVTARGGYSAVSIQDYTRISNERSEFLNFLLTPNPSGVPATEYGALQVA